MRDDLYRDLLKSPAERMQAPRFAGRMAKFSQSEIIVRRIDDRAYPDFVESDRVSGWFKVEVLDFYHGGLECILESSLCALRFRHAPVVPATKRTPRN